MNVEVKKGARGGRRRQAAAAHKAHALLKNKQDVPLDSGLGQQKGLDIAGQAAQGGQCQGEAHGDDDGEMERRAGK